MGQVQTIRAVLRAVRSSDGVTSPNEVAAAVAAEVGYFVG
jgi:hypothetical protein